MKGKRYILWQQLGREPTPAELGEALDMTPEKVVEIQGYGRRPASLDEQLYDEGDQSGYDVVADDEPTPLDTALVGLRADELDSTLLTLGPREGRVMRLRHGLEDGEPKTLDQIGQIFGLTRERIRQIEAQTKAKLRYPSRSKHLRDYLD